jgi:hypothetical protein
MYTGGRLGMSAAFATVANNATAPATDATFTLTMHHLSSRKVTQRLRENHECGEDGSECLSRD